MTPEASDDLGRVERQSPSGGEGCKRGNESLFTDSDKLSIYPSMADVNHFSRAQMCVFAGVDTTALGYWIKDGLIQSIELDARKHRRFTRDEALIASTLGAARRNGMTLPTMRRMADKMRKGLELYRRYPFQQIDMIAAQNLRQGAHPDEVFAKYLTDGDWQKRDPDLPERAVVALEIFPFDLVHSWILGSGIATSSGVIMCWQDEDGEWQFQNVEQNNEKKSNSHTYRKSRCR